MIKLYRGDCLKMMDRIPDQSVDLIACDLPYGITANSWDSEIPLDDLFQSYKRLLKPHGTMTLMAGEPFTSTLILGRIKEFRYRITWDKVNRIGGFLNARKRPMRIVEDIIIFRFGNGSGRYHPPMLDGQPYKQSPGRPSSNYNQQTKGIVTENLGDRWPVDLLKIPAKERGEPLCHPTQKPVRLMIWLVETYSNVADVVLDNCMGVGTTGVACVRMKRSFIGIEKDKKYFQLAKQRIEREQGLRRDIVKPDSFQKTFIESIAEGMA